MDTIILYFIKCFGLIALFFLAYHFLLRKETFFNGNRWFLLAGLFTSVLLPFVFFTKIIWIETTLNQTDWSNIPVANSLNNETFEINWLLILGIVYALGLLVLLIKFGIDFYSLNKILKGKKIRQQEDFKFIEVSENLPPFSYFNYIVYNSDLYSASELEYILEHEKVHSSQNHSVDVLFSRLFCIIFWYNPFMWWYKNAILQNLEFIADSEATKNLADKKAYQITLLKITTHENCVSITNHFYQPCLPAGRSLIKKRIVMLNKNQSKKWNSLKYALVIPALVAFMFLFQIKVVAQEKEAHSSTQENNEIVLKIDKNATDEFLKSESVRLKQDQNIIMKFSKVKRNSKGEITGIKFVLNYEERNNSVSEVSGDQPIKAITFVKTINKNGKAEIGYYIPNNVISQKKITAVNSNNIIAIQEISSPEAPNKPEDPQAPRNQLAQTINVSKQGKQTFAKNSYYSDEKPLIVIDGVKNSPGNDDLSTIDPEIIESITVLKGLKATAKYGNEAGSGVIEIKTKQESTAISTSFNDENEQAKIDAIQAKKDSEQAKIDAIQAKSDLLQARQNAEQARKDAQQARKYAKQAKIDAAQAKKDAANQ